jgi:hypothetical protein
MPREQPRESRAWRRQPSDLEASAVTFLSAERRIGGNSAYGTKGTVAGPRLKLVDSC